MNSETSNSNSKKGSLHFRKWNNEKCKMGNGKKKKKKGKG